MAENTYTHEFPCGMQFVFKKTDSPVAYCALSIKSGTRNEQESLRGIAHLTEHMMFKGTLRRTPRAINDRLEKLGGDINAYTTKEETVIYATVLKEDTAKAADLVLELAFQSTFPEKELEKERHVVTDEINMYKDSPSEYIFDQFEECLFKGSSLSRSILGDARSLRRITSTDLKNYVEQNYRPERMCLSLVADLSWQKALKIASDAISAYIPEGRTARTAASDSLSARGVVSAGPFHKEITKRGHQIHCIIGTSAPSFFDSRRIAMVLLNNILGGSSSNSRLNQSLREKNALVYSVDSTYCPFSDTGSLMIYFGCDKENLERCTELILKELSLLREKPLSERALRAAKKQLLGQLAISSDNGENQALSLGKSMIIFGHILSDDIIRERINGITAGELRDTACEILAEDKLSTLIYK